MLRWLAGKLTMDSKRRHRDPGALQHSKADVKISLRHLQVQVASGSLERVLATFGTRYLRRNADQQLLTSRHPQRPASMATHAAHNSSTDPLSAAAAASR
jgi:hypothetical protein